MKANNLHFAFVISFSFILQTSLAQGNLSPYSRYGLGSPSGGAQPVLESLGGSSAAYSDSGTINLQQPASLVSLGSGLVILEAGFTANAGYYSYLQKKSAGTDASFGYLALAVPVINKRWAVSFSLSPYSSAAYSLRDTSSFAPGLPVEMSSTATGGYSRMSLSNAVRLGKNLSVGLGLHYLFGRTDYLTETRFPEDENIRSSSLSKSQWLNGLDYGAGLVYQKRFHRPYTYERNSEGQKTGTRIFKGQDSLHLIVGMRFSPMLDLRGSQGMLATSFLGNYQYLDTLLYTDQNRGYVRLPMRAGLSFALKNSHDKWLLMADLSYTDWNQFRNFGQADSLRSSYRIGLGGQYQPRPDNLNSGIRNYFQRIKYRAGLYYSDGYLQLSGRAIPEMGISIGLGLPFIWKTYNANKSAIHSLNFALTASQKGFSSDKEICEQALRLSVAIAFNDRWFHKRQYE